MASCGSMWPPWTRSSSVSIRDSPRLGRSRKLVSPLFNKQNCVPAPAIQLVVGIRIHLRV